MMPGRSASTLVEVLVALAVFSLITALLAGVFLLSHRYTRVSQQLSRAQREAAQCMQAFSSELKRSHSQSFQATTATNETWFLSNRPPVGAGAQADFASSGEVLWQKWVAIWCQADGVVYRGELGLVGGAVPFSQVDLGNAPSSLAAISTQPGKKRLAAAIRRFRVSLDERVVTVDLESETSNSGNPPTRYYTSSSFLIP